MAEPIRITVQGVLEDLENGYTRNAEGKFYKGEGFSIGEKYGLNKSQVADLFKHEKLKGRKVKMEKTPAFILIDEEETTVDSAQLSIDAAIAEAEFPTTVEDSFTPEPEAIEEPQVDDSIPSWLSE